MNSNFQTLSNEELEQIDGGSLVLAGLVGVTAKNIAIATGIKTAVNIGVAAVLVNKFAPDLADKISSTISNLFPSSTN